MEARFGADFSDVRIHTGAQAASSAAAVAAEAYTVGSDIVFGRDAFAPSDPEGKLTLAHELAHVLQQRRGAVSGRDVGSGVQVSDPSDVFEQDAEATARRVARRPSTGLRPSQIGFARQENGLADFRIQRKSSSADAIPSTLTCPVSTSLPPEAATIVIFPKDGTLVDAPLEKVIDAFLDIWNDIRTTKRAGVGDPLEVHGFASLTGPAAHNWDLSCHRAEAVRAALQARMTAKGWPIPKIDVLAHGPTDMFDPAPLRNQRAMITATKPDDYRGTVTKPPAATFPGLGARKAALRSNGGSLLEMAVAMIETETMDPHEYPFGDGKTKGAACFGIFKQNWDLIRTSGAMPAWSGPVLPGQSPLGLEEANWERGRELNDDLKLDLDVRRASQAKLGGLNQWFAGHRQGSSGLAAFRAAASGSTTAEQRGLLSDIADYQSAVEWIVEQLKRDPTLQTDDRKVFVRVPPV